MSKTCRYGRKLVFFSAISLFFILKFSGYLLLNKYLTSPGPNYELSSYSTGRHLLSGVSWEQCDYELGKTRDYSNSSTWETPSHAYKWIPLYVVLLLILFVALAVVCDDFFVPSLEAISEKLDLSEDVAGATFMAAGSSAPELFTSIAGVTADSDVGVGTIVGSAVFNLLGIIALSAAFSGGDLHLDWRPLTRDSIFYALSIVLFIIFAWDGKYELYEAIITLVLYFIYIVIMKFNKRLMRLLDRISGKKKTVRPSLVPEKTEEGSQGNNDRRGSTFPKTEEIESSANQENDPDRRFSHKKGSATKLIKEISSDSGSAKSNKVSPEVADEDDGDDGIHVITLVPWCPPVSFDVPAKNENGLVGIPRLLLAWTLFLMALPFIILYTWTIPDCSTPRTRKWYLFSFTMSIVWIAALSFGTVTLVGRAGCILQIDKFTMGLVVVAVGTSIPDAMSSILVARDGFGDMAVSNAIGSNVFDIDLGIGLPFLITICIKGHAITLLKPLELAEFVDNGYLMPHAKFGIILLILLVASISIFAISKFRLTRKLGLSFVILYFIFVGYAYVQDLICDSRFC